MSFIDQKPRIATEQDLVAPWDGALRGKNFRCHLCGHRFVLGETWRFVLATQVHQCNFLVCTACDGPDVLERWQQANEEAKTRFWWLWEAL
jgi:hypothetical protein